MSPDLKGRCTHCGLYGPIILAASKDARQGEGGNYRAARAVDFIVVFGLAALIGFAMVLTILESFD